FRLVAFVTDYPPQQRSSRLLMIGGIMIMVMVAMGVPAMMVTSAATIRLIYRFTGQAARILAEHEGFHRHRHRTGWHPDAAQVDIIEIQKRHAVDHQNRARDAAFLAQNRAKGLRNVAVKDDE